MSVCSSHWYPHWSPCGGALRLFRTWVAHHPLTSRIFALLIQLTPRAAHETRKNCSLFVTIRAGTLVLTWEPLALWRWPVKVILSRKTARWETHLTDGARCGNFTVLVAQGALLSFSLATLRTFFSLTCCKVCEYAGCGTRRGGVVVVPLGDRVWVRKSILDSDWPFSYDGQSRIPVLGVYRISVRLRLLHCAVWRLKIRFKHLLVTTGWSIRTVFAFFFKQIDSYRAAVDSQANQYPRLLCVCVFVCSI